MIFRMMQTALLAFAILAAGCTTPNGNGVTIQNPDLVYAAGVRTAVNIYILHGKTIPLRAQRATLAINLAGTITTFVGMNEGKVTDMSLAKDAVNTYISGLEMADVDRQALQAFNAEIFALIEDGVIQVEVGGSVGDANAYVLTLVASNIIRAARTYAGV